MLHIVLPAAEFYDETKGVFVNTKEQALQLEHSLVSLAKWESKWEKPFLSGKPKTFEETVDYIRCMTLTQNVSPMVYKGITNDVINRVNTYIEAPMTATWFSGKNENRKQQRKIITAEILYYEMIALDIPFECQKWHLNRLLTLIRVCAEESAPKKKMSKRENLNHMRQLNAARRKKLNSRG